MTLTQFEDYLRRRHKAGSSASPDTNWASEEIWQLITARSNEILSIIGLLEETDTSITTVAGTQVYAVPTGVIRIRALAYDGELLKRISWEQAETYKTGGSFPQRKPEAFLVWDNYIYLVPTPDAAETVTIYYEKEHPYIDNVVQTTVDIPSALHYRLADGVLADMFTKDLNMVAANHFEQLWISKHLPAFQRYAMDQAWGHSAQITDVESVGQTDWGVI